MANRANYRIVRTKYSVIAALIVIVLAVVLYIRVGLTASTAVLQAFGIVSLTIIVGSVIFEKWLWKTIIGQIIGCPPDYSGKWEGHVKKIKGTEANKEKEIKITVYIIQNLLDIEWHQIGYDENGNIKTESHLLLGEVIDEHRRWSSICGLYEVNQKDKGSIKHYGSQLVDISIDEKTISGSYCSTVGNVGTIYLKKV